MVLVDEERLWVMVLVDEVRLWAMLWREYDQLYRSCLVRKPCLQALPASSM